MEVTCMHTFSYMHLNLHVKYIAYLYWGQWGIHEYIIKYISYKHIVIYIHLQGVTTISSGLQKFK